MSTVVTKMYCAAMTKPFEDIAARIKWHRGLLKLNQEDYAALINAKRSALANWEAGHKRVSLDAALAMREKFGLSLDFIYEGIEDALSMSLRKELLDKPIEMS